MDGRNATDSPPAVNGVSEHPQDPPAPLSPLKGVVCAQYVRCGKSECRCQRGEPHGPYYYRVWREGERVQKVYVKASELEAVRAACDAHREITERLEQLRREREKLTHGLRDSWRATKRLLKQPKKHRRKI